MKQQTQSNGCFHINVSRYPVIELKMSNILRQLEQMISLFILQYLMSVQSFGSLTDIFPPNRLCNSIVQTVMNKELLCTLSYELKIIYWHIFYTYISYTS